MCYDPPPARHFEAARRSSEMHEEPKGFTVNDRRHFTPDGSPRDGVQAETASAPSLAPAKAPETEAAEPMSGAEPVDFSGFLVSLATQASLHLGLAAEAGEEPRVDLGAARQIVSIIEMLRNKTEGRRTPEEDRLLESILYELRLAWVQRARGGAA